MCHLQWITHIPGSFFRIHCFYCFIVIFSNTDFLRTFSFIFKFLLTPKEGLFSTRNIVQICLNIYIFCFILLFTSSSSCRKEGSVAVLYFSTSCYFTDPGLHLGDPAPLIGLSLWTCWYFIYFGIFLQAIFSICNLHASCIKDPFWIIISAFLELSRPYQVWSKVWKHNNNNNK